jgi:RHS repeat-associated protein
MPLAARQETLSPPSDPCVFFPLAADPAELETRLGTTPQLSENSRQGFRLPNRTPHQGSAWSNSGTALGIAPVLLLEGVRSRCKGKERDLETGNDDFGARYYSSSFGRWLSPDWSSVPAPVPYANLSNPQTLNLYAMVRDNPESFADLDGHCFTRAQHCCTSTSRFAWHRRSWDIRIYRRRSGTRMCFPVGNVKP